MPALPHTQLSGGGELATSRSNFPTAGADGRVSLSAPMNGSGQVPNAATCPAARELNGHPVELGVAWTLRKGEKRAQCVPVSHELGWEPRLMTTDLLRSQVCRSSDEVLDTSEKWKAAMLEKGWR